MMGITTASLRPWAAFFLLIAVAGLIGYLCHGAFELGQAEAQARLSDAIAAYETARADAVAKVADAEKHVAAIEADAVRKMALASARAAGATKIVERVVHDTPQFSHVVRPADLRRVRSDELAAIAAAADRSAELSALLVRGVRNTPQDRR